MIKNTASITRLSLGLMLTLGSLLTPASAFAQGELSLTAIPPRLYVDAKPGAVVYKEIKVRNESSGDRIVSTKIKDFVVNDDGSGVPKMIDDKAATSNNRWAASSWISVSPSSVKLKPGETKSLTLTVLVPENALPGGHYAAVLHAPNVVTSLNGTGAKIQPNVGTLVYVSVAGKVKQAASVREFYAPNFSEYGPVNFSTVVENLSDIHINPKGSITVTNLLGGQTAKLAIDKEENIFPYTSKQFKNVLERKFLFGRYKAQLNLSYGNAGGLLAATLFFWVIPWKLIIVILTLVALIVALYLINRKKPGSSTPSSPSEKIDELEKELNALKNKYKDRK